MSNYRRYRVRGGCYFFTVNLLKRDQHLLTEYIDSLRHAFRVVKPQRGFQIEVGLLTLYPPIDDSLY